MNDDPYNKLNNVLCVSDYVKVYEIATWGKNMDDLLLKNFLCSVGK